MQHCWDLKPNNRPSFQTILTKLKQECESHGSTEDYVYDEGEPVYDDTIERRA